LLRPEPARHRDLEKFRAYTRSWLTPASEEESGDFQVWATDQGPPSHSVPPHLVAKAAAQVGAEAFERIHQRLLRAYFSESRDITDWNTLEELWRELDLPAEAFAVAHQSATLQSVLRQYRRARELGATGVPAIQLVGNEAVIVGAHPADLYRRWIDRSLARRE
jgi:predicted DsbA family dithiol-disulfide isomerase